SEAIGLHAKLGGQRFPRSPECTLLCEVALVGRELFKDLGKQFLIGHNLVRARTRIDYISLVRDHLLVPAVIPPSSFLFAYVVLKTVSSHGGKESQEMLRVIKFESSKGCPNKKVGKYRLADIHRIKEAP